ncbi:MAG TPA: hypothetical protein PLZ44_05795, partial [Methanothrix sp.]|nr:hypothetical protein [Methanothrix sp.]
GLYNGGVKPKHLSDKREGIGLVQNMSVIDIIEGLQSLLILAIFVGIIAVSFKVWRWNYVTPPK